MNDVCRLLNLESEWGVTITAPLTVNPQTSEFFPVFGFFYAVMVHGDAGFADRNPVRFNSKIILIPVIAGIAQVEVNKRCNVFAFAVIIKRIGVMGRIQEKFFHVQFWEV